MLFDFLRIPFAFEDVLSSLIFCYSDLLLDVPFFQFRHCRSSHLWLRGTVVACTNIASTFLQETMKTSSWFSQSPLQTLPMLGLESSHIPFLTRRMQKILFLQLVRRTPPFPTSCQNLPVLWWDKYPLSWPQCLLFLAPFVGSMGRTAAIQIIQDTFWLVPAVCSFWPCSFSRQRGWSFLLVFVVGAMRLR